MQGFWLLVPFFLVRFGLLGVLNQTAIARAAHFPPMIGREKFAYWVYQLTNIVFLIYLCFCVIPVDFSWIFYAGAVLVLLGFALLLASVAHFALPEGTGLNRNGLYRVSRNPMYVSYFFYFIGCALLARSAVLCGLVLVFQIAAHRMILAEERWCAARFGAAYVQYAKQVRRYIGRYGK